MVFAFGYSIFIWVWSLHLTSSGMVLIGMARPLPTGPGDSVVEVVPPDIELDPRIFDELRITIDPLTVCGDYGVELYVNCVTFIQSRI